LRLQYKQYIDEQNKVLLICKRIHHTIGFWIFLLLLLVAIVSYIMTLNFALVPDWSGFPMTFIL